MEIFTIKSLKFSEIVSVSAATATTSTAAATPPTHSGSI